MDGRTGGETERQRERLTVGEGCSYRPMCNAMDPTVLTGRLALRVE
jgi:hypothetical protein